VRIVVRCGPVSNRVYSLSLDSITTPIPIEVRGTSSVMQILVQYQSETSVRRKCSSEAPQGSDPGGDEGKMSSQKKLLTMRVCAPIALVRGRILI